MKRIDIEESNQDKVFKERVTEIINNNKPHELNKIFSNDVDHYSYERNTMEGFSNFAGQLIHIRTTFKRKSEKYIQLSEFNFDSLRGAYYYTSIAEIKKDNRELFYVPLKLELANGELNIAREYHTSEYYLHDDIKFAYKMFKQLRPPFN